MGNTASSPAATTTTDASPFNAKSTADDVAASLALYARGRTMIVTGANCGIGLETARVLAAHGAKVFIMSRSAENGKRAVSQVKEKHPDADVSSMVLDLSSFESVRACAKDFIDSGRPLHVIINNAGVMGTPRTLSKDGYELAFATNHLGHFLLTNLLLPVMIQSVHTERRIHSDPARVINISSMGNWLFAPPEGLTLDDLDAKKHYDSWDRYGQSKLANILFTHSLQTRARTQNLPILSVSVHPGCIADTQISRNMAPTALLGMLNTMWATKGSVRALFNDKVKTVEQGAATSVYAALAQDLVAGEHYADCALSTCLHAKARDDDLAKRLWDVSVKATGLPEAA